MIGFRSSQCRPRIRGVVSIHVELEYIVTHVRASVRETMEPQVQVDGATLPEPQSTASQPPLPSGQSHLNHQPYYQFQSPILQSLLLLPSNAWFHFIWVFVRLLYLKL